MKVLLSYAKCMGVVLGIAVAFTAIWVAFKGIANPYLVEAMMYRGVPQSRVHLLAVDSLEFLMNHSVLSWWWMTAFFVFIWIEQKRERRALFRRIAIAVYLAPFIALTGVLIAAAVFQKTA